LDQLEITSFTEERNKMVDFNKFNPLPHFENLQEFKTWATAKVSHISAETFGWLAVIVLHAATIPSLLAVMSGLTDKMPAVDLVLLCWGGLTLLFVKATVQKDMLNVVTIGLGFIVQAVMMALIFFK
jgi:broad specificity phosphatase PhoE